MAIARLSVKVGKAGKAAAHAGYIARLGRYAGRLERGEKLEAAEAGNMPAWARSNPLTFWQAADAHERKNGSTYREFEIALPRELPHEARAELVRDFVRQEIGAAHVYQWAIHTPTAADGGEQPHLHLMFSERQRDGIERDPEQYFRRYNPKSPERGGAKKGYGPNAGKTLSRAERAAELKALRTRWGDLCNAHLERAGVEQRIDMRSHAERGDGIEPERKQLPSAWRGQGRDNVIQFRQARQEMLAARQELARVVPDASAEIISLEAERAQRAALEAQLEAERLAEGRRRDIQERAMLRHGYRTDSWEIRERWAWRQQEREMRRIEAERLAEAERERRPALEIAAAWAQLVMDARRQVEAQARRAAETLRRQQDRNWWRRTEHQKQEPTPPTGLFAAFQRGGYERELALWQGRRERLEARQQALSRRSALIDDCIGSGMWHGKTGDRLAEVRAARKSPQLAAEVRERASEIQRARKIQQQQVRQRQPQRGQGRGGGGIGDD
ncbi:MobA/MobL family protein [Acidithiobacillus thiooxidans]|uniref:MobA/MobL family protein n=1 Tax=Acidithiobacillus thiooxidans TaxID=930 RepID=UPI001C07B33B|nr:MobA/MobL family protein [Acidithiobacillus thiooxidans]MBU2843696.1 MobA/MobL family protein [Acidithiobacillus thiooxidans]